METISTYTTKYPWLVAVIVGGLFYIAGQFIHLQVAPATSHDLAINGVGEVDVRPDVATITLGVTTGPQTTAGAANEMLSQKVTSALVAVEAAGVSKEDTKTTNLSINPIYDYPNGRQVLRGFEGSQQIEVKIRNLDSVGDLITRTTAEGINQVGGIAFTVDKPEELQKQAEDKAIANAKEKADRLAKSLGVRIKGVKFYSSNVSVPGQGDTFLAREGLGGGGGLPTPGGTQTITANVNITYEIR